MKILKDVISLKFRTSSGNGVLLHGGGQQGDYISLELHRARLQLSINLGSKTVSSLTKCCLNMHWIFTPFYSIKLMPDRAINNAVFCWHIFQLEPCSLKNVFSWKRISLLTDGHVGRPSITDNDALYTTVCTADWFEFTKDSSTKSTFSISTRGTAKRHFLCARYWKG